MCVCVSSYMSCTSISADYYFCYSVYMYLYIPLHVHMLNINILKRYINQNHCSQSKEETELDTRRVLLSPCSQGYTVRSLLMLHSYKERKKEGQRSCEDNPLIKQTKGQFSLVTSNTNLKLHTSSTRAGPTPLANLCMSYSF